MVCYHPNRAWLPKDGGRLVWNERKATQTNWIHYELSIPCQQCIGCKLNKSCEWALRIKHESQFHMENSFLTLTYNNENLPDDYCVSVREHQLFMKKLRKKYGKGIRFYMCGEYGDDNRRPHYHYIIFGHDFSDKKIFKQNRDGDNLYTSKELTELWGKGHATTGAVTFKSAAYTARYIAKKINGKPAAEHYKYVHPLTGELINQTPEFGRMSLQPGIGLGWFEKYSTDVYPHDYCINDGKKTRPPRYYDKLLAKLDPLAYEAIKIDRELSAFEHSADQTPERLAVREEVKQSRISQLKREL